MKWWNEYGGPLLIMFIGNPFLLAITGTIIAIIIYNFL